MPFIGIGAKLEYESGSSWVEVANCKSINFPQFNVSNVDTTSLSNTDYGMSFMPGMIDPGSITFEAEYSSATFTALHGFVHDDAIGWRVSDPDGVSKTVTCDGFLVKCDVSFSPTEEVMISGEIKMTGLPVVS